MNGRKGGGYWGPSRCGIASAQLKLHVGLVVPRVREGGGGGGRTCAWLTGAGEASVDKAGDKKRV